MALVHDTRLVEPRSRVQKHERAPRRTRVVQGNSCPASQLVTVVVAEGATAATEPATATAATAAAAEVTAAAEAEAAAVATAATAAEATTATEAAAVATTATTAEATTAAEAAAATTAEATTAAAAEAAAATTAAEATTTAPARLTLARLVDAKGATVEILAVPGRDHGLGVLVGGDLDEGEATAATRLTIHHDGGTNDLLAAGGKRLHEALIRGAEGEVADVELACHEVTVALALELFAGILSPTERCHIEHVAG